jgi:hypothetical protein
MRTDVVAVAVEQLEQSAVRAALDRSGRWPQRGPERCPQRPADRPPGAGLR